MTSCVCIGVQGGASITIGASSGAKAILRWAPSAQVTRYNKGFTNPEVGTVEDEMSQYDVSVILGVTTTPPGKGTNGTWSIWPSGRLFEEEFRGWDGEWNTTCEQWFMDSWS